VKALTSYHFDSGLDFHSIMTDLIWLYGCLGPQAEVAVNLMLIHLNTVSINFMWRNYDPLIASETVYSTACLKITERK